MKPVVFVIGNDITSWTVLSTVLKIHAQQGVNVQAEIWLTESPAPKPTCLLKLRQLYFFERSLPQMAIAFAQSQFGANAERRLLTPLDMQAMGLTVRRVHNINSKEARHWLKELDPVGVVSIRCYQKFGRKFIKNFYAHLTRFLINLHPGELPRYRGVFTVAHAMRNLERLFAFTLHRMNKDWDAGPILGLSSYPLDYSKSALENMLMGAERGAKLLVQTLMAHSKRGLLKGVEQDEMLASYYTSATADELRQLSVPIYCPEHLTTTLTTMLAPNRPQDQRALRNVLEEAIATQAPTAELMGSHSNPC